MYLKRLEMENFKSFKGEVVVPYERGFTAITGPNGSGKSNCGDAIQFVLGYKSAKDVRANNVLDLLFNGGKNNKPAKFCKVSLIFDNPEDSGPNKIPIRWFLFLFNKFKNWVKDKCFLFISRFLAVVEKTKSKSSTASEVLLNIFTFLTIS